jgi:serine/threonine protein kinase
MSRKEPKVFDSGFETYTVVQQLGSGGAGTVYEVKASDGQRLALKALDRSGVSRKQLARFRNEMRFCSQPRSRHIIQVIDQGKGDEEVLGDKGTRWTRYLSPPNAATDRLSLFFAVSTERSTADEKYPATSERCDRSTAC